jgi:sulfite reductase alpha subunit-like flavoprotein
VVDERYPQFTLIDAFKHYLDITSPLTQKMLMYFSSQTSNENERIQLEKLSKDPVAYEEWKLNKYPNLAEVLEEFPNLRPNASLLITQLPKLQPRFYSVSSSPKVSDDITITAGVVEYRPPKGKNIHYGVCTKWLDEIKIGEIVPAYIRGFDFNLFNCDKWSLKILILILKELLVLGFQQIKPVQL